MSKFTVKTPFRAALPVFLALAAHSQGLVAAPETLECSPDTRMETVLRPPLALELGAGAVCGSSMCSELLDVKQIDQVYSDTITLTPASDSTLMMPIAGYPESIAFESYRDPVRYEILYEDAWGTHRAWIGSTNQGAVELKLPIFPSESHRWRLELSPAYPGDFIEIGRLGETFTICMSII